MNIEEFINRIKKRPGMYVGCIELKPIVHFIDGFMYNNVVTGRIDTIEKEFREKFDDWVREQLEKQYKIELQKHRGYMFYITQVNQNPEEGLKILFELCDEFFREFHEKEDGKKNIS